MRVLIFSFCICFGIAFATTRFEANVRFQCTVNTTFRGSVQMLEWDTFSDDPITSEVVFEPSQANVPNEHNFTLIGHESETFGDQDPYLKFRHNCDAAGKHLEYDVFLDPCSTKAWKCLYEVDVVLGEENSYILANFQPFY